MLRDRHFWMVAITGFLLGLLGVMLAVWGNPENSGICVSCFIENSAGALGFHDNPRMQYLRPELLGFVLGSMLCAIATREFTTRIGTAPLFRIISGIFLMVGCALFIGCPIKLFLRLAAGDLTSLAGIAGMICGVWLGVRGMANGVDTGPVSENGRWEGVIVPALFLMLLLILLVRPGFLLYSSRGSAAQHAPIHISLIAGVVLGALAQRSRFCITGSIRDLMLMGRRSYMLWGFILFLITATISNLVTGRFKAGLYGQPGAHLDHIWSFLGMGLTGWISVMMNGCPFRQLVKAGGGDADAGLVVVGMFIGGALVQSWGVAATAAGVSLSAKVATLAGFAFVAAGSLLFRKRYT